MLERINRLFLEDKIKLCFSLRYLQNEASEIPSAQIESDMILTPTMLIQNNYSLTKTPGNPMKQRSNSLTEITDNKIFNIGIKEPYLPKVKLPSLDHVRPLQKRKIYKNTVSLDNCKTIFEFIDKIHE